MTTLINKLVLVSVGASMLLSLPIGGCIREIESNSYMASYTIYNGIDMTSDGNSLNIKFIAENHVSIESRDAEKQLYDALCRLNGDTMYNGVLEKHGAFITGGYAYYPNINAINLVSDTDFDAEHPVGTSLNDCFELEYEHYEKFDENGRKTKRVKLSEIGEIKCITNDLKLFFIIQPTKDVTLTATITTDNGKVFTSSCTHNR